MIEIQKIGFMGFNQQAEYIFQKLNIGMSVKDIKIFIDADCDT